MRRILTIRKSRKAFGRGSLDFLRPGNRNVLAYIREYEDEALLCVVNLARSAQPVELDLREFRGRIPVELMGGTSFPPIGELPYLLTLPAHGFYWFELATESAAKIPTWHEQRLPREESPWLVLFAGLESFELEAVAEPRRPLTERLRRQVEREILPAFLSEQRWFAAKGATLEHASLGQSHLWRGGYGTWLLTLVDTQTGGEAQRYFLPLAVAWEHEKARMSAAAPAALARVRQQSRTGLLFDAFADEAFCRDILRCLQKRAVIGLDDASLNFLRTDAFESLATADLNEESIRRPHSEGSNSTLLIGDRLFLKGYRRVRSGINPEWEMGRFLTEVSPCEHIAPVAGALEYREAGREPVTLALVQAAVPNQGDGWGYTRDYLSRYLEQAVAQDGSADGHHESYLLLMRTLGARTAELHIALAAATGDPAFDPVPIDEPWLRAWVERIVAEAELTLDRLRRRRDETPEAAQRSVDALLDSDFSPQHDLAALAPSRIDAARTRYHGDYHLGQVLITENDFVITDFEGEPGRSFEERRAKHTPLKDVAGMLRSFPYVRDVVAKQVLPQQRATDVERARSLLEDWAEQASGAFLSSYEESIGGCAGYPREREQAQRLLLLAKIEKTLYEIRYELDSRPDWLELPLGHLRDLIATELRR